MATDKIVVLVTCGSAAESRRIARKLVEGKRAACVNILSAPVESIYRWRGKVESARAIEPLCMLWCLPGFLRNDWMHAFKVLHA